MALFVQAMLSKIDQEIIEHQYVIENMRLISESFYNLYTPTETGTYKMKFKALPSSNGFTFTLKYANGTTNLYSRYFSSNTNIDGEEITLDSTSDTVQYRTPAASYGGGYVDNFYLRNTLNDNIKYKTGKKIKIYELKSIGEKLNGYLFGMLPNGEWRDGN